MTEYYFRRQSKHWCWKNGGQWFFDRKYRDVMLVEELMSGLYAEWREGYIDKCHNVEVFAIGRQVHMIVHDLYLGPTHMVYEWRVPDVWW